MNSKKLKNAVITTATYWNFNTSIFLNGWGNLWPIPITLKGYTGDKTNTVSYGGQIARHAIHDSKGTG